jgi:hypothetical protein
MYEDSEGCGEEADQVGTWDQTKMSILIFMVTTKETYKTYTKEMRTPKVYTINAQTIKHKKLSDEGNKK